MPRHMTVRCTQRQWNTVSQEQSALINQDLHATQLVIIPDRNLFGRCTPRLHP
jgi:hypothetical protein